MQIKHLIALLSRFDANAQISERDLTIVRNKDKGQLELHPREYAETLIRTSPKSYEWPW